MKRKLEAGVRDRRGVQHPVPEPVAFGRRLRRRHGGRELVHVREADRTPVPAGPLPGPCSPGGSPRDADVSRVAADAHIRHPGVERQPVQRRVRLDEPAVPLSFEGGHHRLTRLHDRVEPRRHLVQVAVEVRCSEHQQGTDHLHPGGAALRRRADHDVAVAEREAVPARVVPDDIRYRTTESFLSGHRADVHDRSADVVVGPESCRPRACDGQVVPSRVGSMYRWPRVRESAMEGMTSFRRAVESSQLTSPAHVGCGIFSPAVRHFLPEGSGGRIRSGNADAGSLLECCASWPAPRVVTRARRSSAVLLVTAVLVARHAEPDQVIDLAG